MMDRVLRLWLLGVGALGAFCMAASAEATELLLRPESFNAAVGVPLSFSVVSTDVFIRPGELEPKRFVRASLRQGQKNFDLPLVENDVAIKLQGVLTLPEPGAAWLVAHRKGVVWSKTPNGMKIGGKATLPKAEWSARYEKFVKLRLNSRTDDASFAEPLGHALEIVPVSNPADVAVGRDIEVRVLLHGRPTAAELVATWDGFAETPSTFAFLTQTYSSSDAELPTARIRISHPGAWLVRTEIKSPVKNEAYDFEILRAVLEFEVR